MRTICSLSLAKSECQIITPYSRTDRTSAFSENREMDEMDLVLRITMPMIFRAQHVV